MNKETWSLKHYEKKLKERVAWAQRFKEKVFFFGDEKRHEKMARALENLTAQGYFEYEAKVDGYRSTDKKPVLE